MATDESKKYLKKKLRRKFNVFCAHSTIHGVYYFSTSKHWLNRVAWATILISSAVLCGVLGHMIWRQFDVDPTVTLVESTHHPTSKIPFPAVVICDSDLVYGPNTNMLLDLLLRRGYNLTTIEEFFESFDPVTQLQVDDNLKKIHSALEDIGYPHLPLLEMLAKPCEILLVRCIWRSELHNCSEMFRQVLTNVGFCCQFDVDYFRKHSTNISNFLVSPETTKSFQVVIDGQKYYANGTIAVGDCQLFIFDVKNTLTIMDSSINLSPMASFNVLLDVWSMDASEDVKALTRNVRQCILPEDTDIGSSFFSGCISNIILRQVVNRCKCLPYYYTSADLVDYPECTWNRYKCITQNQQFYRGILTELPGYDECFQKCNFVQYDTKVEYIRLVNHEGKMSKENLNHSEVSINFGDPTCMKYRREVLYTWDQMLANLGGIFGLCMGGSIISVIELIYFLFDVLYTTIQDKYGRVKPDISNQDENIFIISNVVKTASKDDPRKSYPFSN